MLVDNDLPEALKSFDSLPNTAQVRLPIVRALFGISSATVWRMVIAGTLKTHKLTPRTTTFNVGELRKFLDKRVLEVTTFNSDSHQDEFISNDANLQRITHSHVGEC